MYAEKLSESIQSEGRRFVHKLKGGNKKSRYSNEATVYKRTRRKQSRYTRRKRRLR